jgi:hypothetical protein
VCAEIQDFEISEDKISKALAGHVTRPPHTRSRRDEKEIEEGRKKTVI